ncbi:MAG: redoxin domain-containing protein [Muribaculaceae bacterium]|nr:redoxin domain-containing protein [Muribaculaceae bacterium]
MKRIIVATIVALGTSAMAMADVTVKLPEGSQDKYYTVHRRSLSRDAQQSTPVVDSVKSVGGVLNIDYKIDEPTQYYIVFDRRYVNLYVAPGENVQVDVTSVDPLIYTTTGTPLMSAISDLRNKGDKIVEEYRAIASAPVPDQNAMAAKRQEYNDMYKNYIATNPAEPASLYAILNLEGEDFLNAYNNIPESMKGAMLYPLVASQKEYVERELEAEKKIEAMQSGNFPAPDFTLKNLEGKDVRLSDFRGKWVIIDFWGSWCGWCIKGFPKLKDAYEQYQPELEIIGVDCNEPEANWRRGVEKYELPWVNVYNPDGSGILNEYGVTGFPTKVIVNPEGKIANLTVGENPAFFDELAKLINGK